MRKLAPLVALLFLVGCMSLVAPRGLKDQIVYAYGGVQAAAETVKALYEAGQISKEDAGSFARVLREAKDKLDAAWSLYKTKPLEAQDQLVLANKLLLLAQQELSKRLGGSQ